MSENAIPLSAEELERKKKKEEKAFTMTYILREQFKVTHEEPATIPGYNAYSVTFESLHSDAKLAMDTFLHGTEVGNTFEVAFAESYAMAAEFNYVARLIITDIKHEEKEVYVVNAISGKLKLVLTVDEKTAKRFNKDGTVYLFANLIHLGFEGLNAKEISYEAEEESTIKL